MPMTMIPSASRGIIESLFSARRGQQPISDMNDRYWHIMSFNEPRLAVDASGLGHMLLLLVILLSLVSFRTN